ncbi:MAG: hypothetical protein COV52_00095 [Gammaproteobacteria bacterium CG11_big_fil_rev_8_21_14_0_20_46_22]|nr:MAG: hypothetical protein COW05_09280 [Gammaproteobacteria bacterium CG12_big_fil_rev_8_21_14_0_65_46_12]PIR12166.1 MAG: hypothetical protein COV52_00095 [Gammaproteobacteria bacterium CG11_big_fil_rev_8_21_14_0_20_46_22]
MPNDHRQYRQYQRHREATGKHLARQQRIASAQRALFVFTPNTVANNPFIYALGIGVLLTYGARMAEAAANGRANNNAASVSDSAQKAFIDHPDWYAIDPEINEETHAACQQQKRFIENVISSGQQRLDSDSQNIGRAIESRIRFFCTSRERMLAKLKKHKISNPQQTDNAGAFFSPVEKTVFLPSNIADGNQFTGIRHELDHVSKFLRTGKKATPLRLTTEKNMQQYDRALNLGFKAIKTFLDMHNKNQRRLTKSQKSELEKGLKLLEPRYISLLSFSVPYPNNINKQNIQAQLEIGKTIPFKEMQCTVTGFDEDSMSLQTTRPIDTLRLLEVYVTQLSALHTSPSNSSRENTLVLIKEKEAYIRQVLGDEAWEHFFHQAQHMVNTDEQTYQESLSPGNRLS